MQQKLFFNRRYFGNAFRAPKVKKTIRIYGGSYKKNNLNNNLMIIVDCKREELLLFILSHKYGIIPI